MSHKNSTFTYKYILCYVASRFPVFTKFPHHLKQDLWKVGKWRLLHPFYRPWGLEENTGKSMPEWENSLCTSSPVGTTLLLSLYPSLSISRPPLPTEESPSSVTWHPRLFTIWWDQISPWLSSKTVSWGHPHPLFQDSNSLSNYHCHRGTTRPDFRSQLCPHLQCVFGLVT